MEKRCLITTLKLITVWNILLKRVLMNGDYQFTCLLNKTITVHNFRLQRTVSHLEQSETKDRKRDDGPVFVIVLPPFSRLFVPKVRRVSAFVETRLNVLLCL